MGEVGRELERDLGRERLGEVGRELERELQKELDREVGQERLRERLRELGRRMLVCPRTFPRGSSQFKKGGSILMRLYGSQYLQFKKDFFPPLCKHNAIFSQK